jgi:hypothetical protein
MSIAPHSHIVTAAHPARPPHMNDSARLNGLATTPLGTDGEAILISVVIGCGVGTVCKSSGSKKGYKYVDQVRSLISGCRRVLRMTLSFSCLRFIMLSRALEIFHNGAMRYMECYQDEYEYEYGLMHRGM